MELQYIHEFVTLVRRGKFQEAAEELYVSQPTLSKHIFALERELGQPLIDRTRRTPLRLTAFGQRFLPHALKLSGAYEELRRDLGSGAGQGKLTIGTSPVVPLFTVFRFLDTFLQNHSDTSVEVVDSSQEGLYELLRTGRCDAVIVQRRPEEPEGDYRRVPYKSDVLSAVLPPDHPLGTRDSLGFGELRSERFVLIEGSAVARTAEELSLREGFAIRDRLSVGRAEALMDIVANGTGVSLLPSAPAHHFARGGVKIVPLEPPVEVRYDLLYRASDRLSPVLEQLIRYLEP